jgi:hypothetical protein
MRKTIKLLALAGLLLATAATSRATISLNWAEWQDPGSFPDYYPAFYPYTYANGTVGSITMPDSSTVNLTFSGEVMGSYDASAFGTSDNFYWFLKNYNGTTYISENVPALPTNSDRIGVSGFGIQNQTITFSSPVSNIVMNLWSLGDKDQGFLGTWAFDQPFVILSANYGEYPNQPFALEADGNNLNGYDGSGTIQFTGTFSSLSWTVLNPEVFSNWNIGVTSAAPPGPGPAPVPEPGQVAASILLLAGIGGYVWMKRRKTAKTSEAKA